MRANTRVPRLTLTGIGGRSDKATVEITSPYSGRVGKLCGDVGTIAQVGGVLCEIEVEGEEGGAGEAEEVSACVLLAESEPG